MNDKQIESAMKEIPEWTLLEGNRITREFKFSNFREAFSFMTECALVAERLNHHPNWTNSYKKVFVELFTHVENALTELDFKLASEMDEIYTRHLP